jgi:hypothetical protein
LVLGQKTFASYGPNSTLQLAPDHGKLLHLFLVGQPNHQAFAHIHPVRQTGTTFEVALPPLPEGDYEMFCDLTLASGLSSTATNSVHLPPIPVLRRRRRRFFGTMDITRTAFGAWNGGRFMNFGEPLPDERWIETGAPRF